MIASATILYRYCGKAIFIYSFGQNVNTGQADIKQANNIDRLKYRLAAHVVQEDRKIKRRQKDSGNKEHTANTL